MNNVDPELIVGLELNTAHVMSLDIEETFNATLIDANHCPGAVMYLFEGYFGSVLATGDFRYTHTMFVDTPLAAAAEIETCYLDNTYLHPMFADLPPLLTMEAMLFRLIHVAFLLLTVTLVSGIFFSEDLFGRALRFDHKTVFAMLSWLIFVALLLGRHLRGWRGRIALRWTLTGFAALLLAYVGSRFVLEVILGRVS